MSGSPTADVLIYSGMIGFIFVLALITTVYDTIKRNGTKSDEGISDDYVSFKKEESIQKDTSSADQM